MFQDEMHTLGFSYMETGGGCDAWMIEKKTDNYHDQNYILITHESNVPTSREDIVTVGFYTVEDFMPGSFDCKFADILDGKVKINIG